MRKRSRSASHMTMIAGTVAILLANALPAGAQDWSIRRAESLESEASALHELKSDWSRAAWFYREAAAVRPTGDAEAVIDLHMAGKLSFYSGNLAQAQEDLAAAGTRAMEGGDVLTAGSLLVDAAWVAGKLGEVDDARSLIVAAQEVLAAPVLSDDVRNSVLTRIDPESATVIVGADFPGVV